MNRCAVPALALLLVSGQAPSPPADAEAVLQFADGTESRRPVLVLDLEELLLDGGGLAPLRVVLPGGWAELEGEDSERMVVELLGGDRIAGGSGGGRGEELLVEGPGGTPIPISIDAIDSVLFPGRIPSDPGIRVERPSEGDRLYRRVGQELDRVDGTLDGFTLEGVRFENLVGLSTVPWEELAALFIEPLGGFEAGAGSAAGPSVVVDLADGSRLSGALLRLDGESLALELPGGTSVRFDLGEVRLISTRDGRLAYLSDLTPSAVDEGSAFGDDFGMVFRHRRDRTVEGARLRCGGRGFARGLGVLAPSRLTYDLASESPWSELRGSVGIDRTTADLGLEGSVRFAVELDGEQVWTSAVVTVDSGLVPLPRIDVSGASELSLVAHMEQDWNTGDFADWLDVRLVRSSDG